MFKWDLSQTHTGIWRPDKQWPIYRRGHHYHSDALLTEVLMSSKGGTVFVINVFPLVTKLGVGWGRNGENS